MTKARDLANAGTALTTVSATELGYLDGVTSAVQTQLNSKIGQATAINPTVVDAKGDIIAATAADTVARLAVGANNTVLTADSSTATGLKWAAAAAGGKVLQVVNATTSTSANTTSNTYIDTNLTATITPTSATSKILVTFFQNGVSKNPNNSNGAVSIRLLRDATVIASPVGNYVGWTQTTLRLNVGSVGTTFLDSPATTSAVTYKTQFNSTLNVDGVYVQDNNSVSSITLMEIGA